MPTIKEIAKISGVSPMTVSNVINGKHNKVSRATIEKIERIMKELDYVPNLSARSLVSKSSNIIVLIIPQSLEDDPEKDYPMHNPFYGEFINSIEFNLRKEGYYMMIRFVAEDEIYSPLLKLWNADGVIVLGTDQRQFDLNLKNIDIPMVLVDSYVANGKDYCTIVNDDRKGGWLAAELLISRGCKKCGVVCTDISQSGVSSERYSGFEAYLKSLNLELDEGCVFEGYPNYEYGVKIAPEIVNKNIDGVFAFSDMVAYGLLEGLKRLNVAIPDEVSVIGFDGLFVGDIIEPKLTSIKQNIYEKGLKSVELMIKALKTGNYRENVVLPVVLEMKETVK